MEGVKVKPSPIEGLGLFAVQPFKAGVTIREVNVVREITDEHPLRPELGERADHCDYPDGRVVLIGPPDRHLNHSCDPNTYIRYEAGRCFIVARQDIPSGQELTCDYRINVTGGDAWPCKCGADRCLGTVAGDCFELPEAFQREYLPFLAEWLVRRHRERIESLG